MRTFSAHNFKKICDILAGQDPDLAAIIQTYGYPPMWTRPNTFETLVHFILEQQVSLASAKAALEKLRETIKEITPANVAKMTDEQFKSSYFSRQKTVYVASLAQAILDKKIDLNELEQMPDEQVRAKLTALKGIGNWTADMYLIFCLHHADVFPAGDLAVMSAFKQIKRLPKDTPVKVILERTEMWKPYRTIATMILWHYYLSSRKKS